MTAADIADIESLTGWDTPALSNALDALRLRPHHSGYSDGSIHRITGAAPMAGRAVTARMVAREPGEDGIPVSYLHRAIAETDGPVVVVLEDCDDPAGAGAAAMRVRDEFGGNEEARGDAYIVRRRRGERSVPLI